MEFKLCCPFNFPDGIFGTLDKTVMNGCPITVYLCEISGGPCETPADCPGGEDCIPSTDCTPGVRGYFFGRTYPIILNGNGTIDYTTSVSIVTCVNPPELCELRNAQAGDYVKIISSIEAKAGDNSSEFDPGFLPFSAGGDGTVVPTGDPVPTTASVTNQIPWTSGDSITVDSSATFHGSWPSSVIGEAPPNPDFVTRGCLGQNVTLALSVQVYDIDNNPAPVAIHGTITLNASCAGDCCGATIADTE